MKKIFLFCIFCNLLNQTQSQKVTLPVRSIVHTNNIRASIDCDNNLFSWRSSNFPGFQAPYFGKQTPRTFYAAAIWDINLLKDKMLIGTMNSYGDENFYYGILDENDSPQSIEEMEKFNKIWVVHKSNILAHIQDYMVNRKIDHKEQEIYSWPGRNNPHFRDYNGANLVKNRDYGAFIDFNHDSNYNPDDGDYPHIKSDPSWKIPDVIHWWVYTYDLLLPFYFKEMQNTIYAYSCVENQNLNNSIFYNIKSYNRSNKTIDTNFVSMWSDFDLGCPEDDYLGCIPHLNTVYCYNSDSVDGTIDNNCFGYSTFGTKGVPVQSITILDKNLVSANFYHRGGLGNPPRVEDPSSLFEALYYMTCKFRDGFPFQEYCEKKQTARTTCFPFSGRPSDSSEISMYTCAYKIADVRSLANTFFTNIKPGEFSELDIAFSFHQKENGNHISNVDFMYDNVEDLIELYKSKFNTICKDVSCSGKFCVWPGDTDNNGNVDHKDVLNIGLAIKTSGLSRMNPLVWLGQFVLDWNNSNLIDNMNNKFADANGDGLVDTMDTYTLTENLNFTHGNYQDQIHFEEGNELILITDISLDSIFKNTRFSLKIEINKPNIKIKGLSIELQYDSRLFNLTFSNSISLDKIWNQPSYNFRQRNIGKQPNVRTAGSSTIISNFGVEFPSNTEIFSRTAVIILNAKDIFESKDFSLRLVNCFYITEDNKKVYLKTNTLKGSISDLPVAAVDIDPIKCDLYPNPSNGVSFLHMNLLPKNIQIYSSAGNIISTFHNISNEKFELPQIAQGMYFVRIQFDKKSIIKKWLVQ